MDLKPFLRAARKFTMDNSPAILTAIGVAGSISTAVLAGKASYRAALKIEAERDAYPREMTPKEKVELVYKEFIPAAVVGAVTILAIIGANHVSSKRAAALAAAFKISEQMAEDYRQKTVEKLGKKAEEEMRSAIAKDRIERVENLGNLVVTGSQELFYDAWSARVFLSTREQVNQAVNQINNQINTSFCASLSDFYDLLNLQRTAVSDEFGWNTDELLEPWFTATLVDGERRAAVEIRYNVHPFRYLNKNGV